VVSEEPALRVTAFEGLTVDYAREIGAVAIIRGVRAMSDFEYEFEMALMNKHLYADVETLFMMPSQEYLYVSSSRLKELTRFGREVDEFVPPLVAKRLRSGSRRRDGGMRPSGFPALQLVGVEERRILLAVTGGIAAYKTPELVRALKRAGHDVRCAMTRAAPSS
jgi:hypothetical protein